MKTKIKNATEERLVKAEEVFGTTDGYVEYDVTETQILLPNGVTANYVKTVKALKGYEILKDITIDIEILDKNINFQLKWTQDAANVWMVQAVINKLIATKRVGSSNGMSQADRELLKIERAKYFASKKTKK